MGSKLPFAEMNNCYEKHSFLLNETVVAAHTNNIDVSKNISGWKGKYNKKNEIRNNEYLKERNSYLGRRYTFQYPNLLEGKDSQDGTSFILLANESYNVVLHDPKYYLTTYRTLIFPRILKRFKVNFNLS